MSTFNDPAPSGDSMPLEGLNGHTVLVKPIAHEAGIVTTFGEKDAIRINVVDLNTGEHALGALWFAGAIIGSLKTQVGQYVLARIAQGNAKPGQKPPWLLEAAASDPAAVAAAEAWLAANPGVLDGFTAPAAAPGPVLNGGAIPAPPLGAPAAAPAAAVVPPLPQMA
jgi:hypothetical protein